MKIRVKENSSLCSGTVYRMIKTMGKKSFEYESLHLGPMKRVSSEAAFSCTARQLQSFNNIEALARHGTLWTNI